MLRTSVSLEARIQRLERRQRSLVVLGLTVSIVFLAAGRRDRSPIQDVVRAENFQLVDSAGHVWIDIRHDSTETGLFVLDDAGDTRIGVAQFAHGGGGVALHGPAARGAAVLYLKGGASLTFYDTAGQVTTRLPAQGTE